MGRRMLAGLGLLALLALSGCTPGEAAVAVNDRVAAEDRTEAAAEGGGGAAAGTLSSWAGGTQLEYSEVPDSLPTGPVTFEITCESLPHNVVLEGVAGEDPLAQCDGPGTVTGETVEIEPAEYTYYCSIPGHREAGMEGTIEAA